MEVYQIRKHNLSTPARSAELADSSEVAVSRTVEVRASSGNPRNSITIVFYSIPLGYR